MIIQHHYVLFYIINWCVYQSIERLCLKSHFNLYGYEYREMNKKKFADSRWSLVNSRSKHKLCEVSWSCHIAKLLTNSRAFEIIQSAATSFPAYAVICRGGRAHISVVYPFNSMNGDNRNEFWLFYASLRWMWTYRRYTDTLFADHMSRLVWPIIKGDIFLENPKY